jgi:hypothetical protein
MAIAAAVALGAFAAACANSEEASPTDSATQPPQPTATATPFHGDPGGETTGPLPSQSNAPVTATPAPGEWNTYTDAAYGYSFDYPASWYLVPPDKGGKYLTLYSYDPSTGSGAPISTERLKAFFWVAEGVYQPIEEWLDEGNDSPGQITPPTIVSREDVTLAGQPGIAEVVELDGVQSVGYYVSLGSGLVFAVDAIPADSDVWPAFEEVLASIRFSP